MLLYKGFAEELRPDLEPTSSEFLCNITMARYCADILGISRSSHVLLCSAGDNILYIPLNESVLDFFSASGDLSPNSTIAVYFIIALVRLFIGLVPHAS